jgi:hypothetical protein
MTFGRLSLAGISSVLLLTVLSTSAARAQDAMDRDLLEVTVP